LSVKNFEKFANRYEKYNIIQKKIIKKYMSSLDSRVVDLGCGSEGLCKYRDFDFYLGIDASENMLNLNPCNVLKLDFNKKRCFEEIKNYDFNQIVSFSALQWARNLEFIFKEIKNLNKNFLLTIFTSKTFSSLHKELNITSPIYSKEEILSYAKILNPKVEILKYELCFDNPKKMLNYIKFSGVKGEVKTNIKYLKKFIKEFPVKKLEFEIVVLKSF